MFTLTTLAVLANIMIMNTLTCYSILSKLTYGGITTHYRCHLRQCDTRQQGSDIFNWLESQLGANSSVCPGSLCRFYTAVAYLPSLPHADYPSHGWLLSLLSFSHELPIKCPSRLVCNTFLLSSSVHNNNFKKVSLTKYSHVIHIHTITTLTLQPPSSHEYQIISAHTHTHAHARTQVLFNSDIAVGMNTHRSRTTFDVYFTHSKCYLNFFNVIQNKHCHRGYFRKDPHCSVSKKMFYWATFFGCLPWLVNYGILVCLGFSLLPSLLLCLCCPL